MSRVFGIVAYLPSGGEVAFVYRHLINYPYRGPLAAAYLAQIACERTGLYNGPDDHPFPEDAIVILAAARTFIALLDAPPKAHLTCPDGCAWISPSNSNDMESAPNSW